MFYRESKILPVQVRQVNPEEVAMVVVAQLVRASVCGAEGYGIVPRLLPQ